MESSIVSASLMEEIFTVAMEKATPDDIPIIDLTETTHEDSDSEEQHENCNNLICKQHGFGLPVVIKPEPGLKNKKVEKQIAKKYLEPNKVSQKSPNSRINVTILILTQFNQLPLKIAILQVIHHIVCS